MAIITSFILKSFVASGILYLYYQVALKNKTFHTYNRVYLLLSVFISLIVPFVDFGWFYIEAAPNIPLNNFVTNISSPEERQTVSHFTTGTILFFIGGFVSALFLISLTAKIIWIYKIKWTSKNTKMRRFTLIETDAEQAPFSFLSNLFWKKGLSATDANGEKIFKHEQAHIVQKHTYDKLFIQIVCCLFWINPFYWLIQKELNTIHEFIADAASIADGDTEAFAKMLLHSHNHGSYLSPAHPFFNSSIKRRLIMISSSNKTQYSFLRRILALPIALFVFAISSVNVKAQTTEVTGQRLQKPSEQPITVSGHKLVRKPEQEPITVTGQKLQKPSQQPITVSGHKLVRKPEQEPITVTGQKLQKPSQQPITVSGHKLVRKPEQEPITVTGQKLQKPSQQPITVSGHKLVRKPEQEPITVTGQKLVKKTE